MRIVAADLDRTVIPNGPASDDNSIQRLNNALTEHNLELIYVTARSVSSVQSAIERYSLPHPRAIIGQVGTTIHLWSDNSFVSLHEWNREITAQSSGWNRELISQELSELAELNLQAESEQNQFKLSYTLNATVHWQKIAEQVATIVKNCSGDDASVTASEDLNSGEAYIDIMPAAVSKFSALEFYRTLNKLSRDSFFCAGDSENDLSMLLSDYSSVIVNNASDELKAKVKAEKVGVEPIVASGRFGTTGNYGSGIVEGLTIHGWIS